VKKQHVCEFQLVLGLPAWGFERRHLFYDLQSLEAFPPGYADGLQPVEGPGDGVFAPNHKLRKGVTALAIGNIGKRGEAATGGHGGDGHATGGCSDAHQKPRSHDTSRIAWAKLLARVGEEFPLECPGCGGDIRLIAFITQPGPIRKILTHLGEPLEPPPIAAARGPPTAWGELIQAHDDREAVQVSPDELPVIDIHSL